jgi:hypothetical protein
MLPAGSLRVSLSFRTPPKNQGSRGLRIGFVAPSLSSSLVKGEEIVCGGAGGDLLPGPGLPVSRRRDSSLPRVWGCPPIP